MFTNPAQFANVTQTLFQFQLETFNTLTTKAIQGVEQVVALNLDTARTTMSDSLAKAREFGAAGDAQSLLASTRAPMGNGQEAAQYNRQLAAIVSNIQQDFSKAAEAHLAEARSNLTALIYDVTRNVRPGSENAVEIVKTAIDNAFAGFERVSRATREAVAAVEAEVARASEQMARAVPPQDKTAAAPAPESSKKAAAPAPAPVVAEPVASTDEAPGAAAPAARPPSATPPATVTASAAPAKPAVRARAAKK